MKFVEGDRRFVDRYDKEIICDFLLVFDNVVVGMGSYKSRLIYVFEGNSLCFVKIIDNIES